MSGLNSKIEQDFKDSLKNKNPLRLSVLRLLISQMKNRKIDKGSDLSDEEVISVISKSVKEREDSIEQYTKAGRSDLADKEKEELEVLKEYMPEEMSREEIEAIVDAVITKGNFEKDPKSFGLIMKEVMSQLKQSSSKSINGNIVSEAVKAKLS